MKWKKILGWILLAGSLFLVSCSWLQDEYFFTYSTDPGLHGPSVRCEGLPLKTP